MQIFYFFSNDYQPTRVHICVAHDYENDQTLCELNPTSYRKTPNNPGEMKKPMTNQTNEKSTNRKTANEKAIKPTNEKPPNPKPRKCKDIFLELNFPMKNTETNIEAKQNIKSKMKNQSH